LIGHYIIQSGHKVWYVDPLADDRADVVDSFDRPAVVLLAHNRHVTYGYTGQDLADPFYFDLKPGSVIVDPWRSLSQDTKDIKVIHYGNTRNNQV
jgi:hypothetical protein